MTDKKNIPTAKLKVRVNSAGYGAKFCIVAPPKCGLHLVDLMIRPIAMPFGPDEFNAPWVSMYAGNSWTTRQVPTEQLTYRIGRVQPGFFVKGHVGCVEEVVQFMDLLGLLVYFVYRDPRDVAVSAAYHILNDDVEFFAHEGREMMFKRYGKDFDSILGAVIHGVGKYPGVMERWQCYKGWLDQDWVFPMKFEDIIADRKAMGIRMMDYMMSRLAKIFGMNHDRNAEGYAQVAAEMARTSAQTHVSPTFRKGQVGNWKSEFTTRHKDLFKISDKFGDLVAMGYEENDRW